MGIIHSVFGSPTVSELVELEDSEKVLEAAHRHLRDEQVRVVGGDLDEA